jgi:dihydrofolate synthase/folylpolyglutamate synthase
LEDDPELWVDVGHNPQAARALAAWLDAAPPKPTRAVFAALGDKDIEGVVAALGTRFAGWHLGGLAAESPRGLSADALHRRVVSGVPDAGITVHPDIPAALAAARRAAGAGGRILAFGSFFTVAAVLRAVRPPSP